MANQNKSVGIAIGVAIALLMGVILIQIIADQTANKVQLVQKVDTLTLVKIGATQANNYTVNYQLTSLDDAWRQDFPECSKSALATGSNIIIYNSSGAEMMDNGACGAGPGDDNDYYIIEGASTLKICNNDNTNSSTFMTVKYNTCPATEYVGGWGQTVFKLIPGFFALALLIGAAFVIFKILREEGVELQI
jgi:hypothetical protein